MERQPASRKTSKLLAYRLHHALHSGSLREVVDELANPTWQTSLPPFPRQPTQAPLSAFDSSIYDGTNLLGAAATALLLPAAFRLAVFALLLERGANPHAAGENGMPAEWVLYRLKGEPEVRDWCLGELEQAKVDQHNMVRYEARASTSPCRALSSFPCAELTHCTYSDRDARLDRQRARRAGRRGRAGARAGQRRGHADARLCVPSRTPCTL